MMKSHNNKALFSNHYLDEFGSLRSQIATSKGKGGHRYLLMHSRSRGVYGRKGKMSQGQTPC